MVHPPEGTGLFRAVWLDWALCRLRLEKIPNYTWSFLEVPTGILKPLLDSGGRFRSETAIA